MKYETTNLFGTKENSWKNEWVGMPEYDNVQQAEPVITALFKFRTEEDYNTFHSLVKKHVYKTNKVFDGMQRKEAKQAWFPLNEKASNYRYV